MRILRASAMGMCFGVREALEKVWALGHVGDTALYGELVHNGEVNRKLAARGFAPTAEKDRTSGIHAPRVVITAHGISDHEKGELESRGKELVDTTCPLVKRAHRTALALAHAGYFVVVVGKPGHVEVKGLTGDLDRFAVVEKPEDVERWDADKIGVIVQTTTPPRTLEAVWVRIVRANFGKTLRLVDTICRPTRDRQRSVEDLLREDLQALVVVGGRNSNNTAQLAALAESRGIKAYRVESAEGLDPAWFEGIDLVGLTAGTSTLDITVDAVERALWTMGSEGGLRRVS